jgi:hypothetical protein
VIFEGLQRAKRKKGPPKKTSKARKLLKTSGREFSSGEFSKMLLKGKEL